MILSCYTKNKNKILKINCYKNNKNLDQLKNLNNNISINWKSKKLKLMFRNNRLS